MIKTDIPDPIKREVRQRCGFGCVICGLPLYEYHHMFGRDHGHIAEEITLLCREHHGQQIRGLLPDEKVMGANDHPNNRRTGVSTPQELHFYGDTCAIRIGGSEFFADVAATKVFGAVVIDDQLVLGFRLIDDHLLLSLALQDNHGNDLLTVYRNELVMATEQWDIEMVGSRLKIRQASRSLLLQMTFYPPNAVSLDRGRFLHDGAEVLVFPDRVVAGGTLIKEVLAHNNLVEGGILVNSSGSGIIGIGQVPRYVAHDPQRDAWLSETFPPE